MTGFRRAAGDVFLTLCGALAVADPGSAFAQAGATNADGAVPPPAPRSSAPVRALEPAALVAELRRGGLVVYLRHTATDFSQNDANSRGPGDCANQRNLTDTGRDQARAIAQELSRLAIPVGRVLASPVCRTMETARLAFGRAELDPAVRGGPAQQANPVRYAALLERFATPLPPGTNVFIASHGNPFYATGGPPYLAEGEAAVIRPMAGAPFEVLARVRWDEWRQFPAAKP